MTQEQKDIMTLLIEEYGGMHTVKPFDGCDEKYKWKFINNSFNKESTEIAYDIKDSNLISKYNKEAIDYLYDCRKPTFTSILNRLCDESKELNSRLATYKEEVRNIVPTRFSSCANDERTASAILTCRYPKKYTFYLPSLYEKAICPILKIQPRTEAGTKYEHYMQIIRSVESKFGSQIQKIMMPQIGDFRIRPQILAVQTLFWVMNREDIDIYD